MNPLYPLIVSKDPEFVACAKGVFSDLAREGCFDPTPPPRSTQSCASQAGRAAHQPIYLEALQRAARFLKAQKRTPTIRLQIANSIREAREQTRRRGICHVGPLLIDASTADKGCHDSPEAFLESLLEGLEAEGIRLDRSPYSKILYQPQLGLDKGLYEHGRSYIFRVRPARRWVLTTDMLRGFMDYYEHFWNNRRAPANGQEPPRITLANEIAGLMGSHFPGQWLFSYFTGSVISPLIEDLERRAKADGCEVIRGPSEHALACGAIANWQVHARPSVIVVTNGMVDEFR